MDKPAPMSATALSVGIVGLALIVAGVLVALFGEDVSTSPSSGVLIRVGAVLGAVALVLPTFKRPSLAALLVAAAGLVLVLARPGLIWIALIGWVVWLIAARQRKTADNES